MYEFIIAFALGFGTCFYIDHKAKVVALEDKVESIVKPQAPNA